jgi:hypothetical protein
MDVNVPADSRELVETPRPPFVNRVPRRVLCHGIYPSGDYPRQGGATEDTGIEVQTIVPDKVVVAIDIYTD